MRGAVFLALAGLVLATLDARAAPVSSLEVAPTTLELTAGEPGLLYVANHCDRPVTVQIDVYDWKQSQNADRLVLSDTAFVSPPLTTIAPGERQIVRVLAEPRQSRGEAAYRVRVSELPDAWVKTSGVQVLLQFSIPVFVRGADDTSTVVWTAIDQGSSLELTARNTGGRTLKLAGLTLSSPGDAPIDISAGRVRYILPEASQVWSANTKFLASSTHLHIAAVDERSGKPLAADLTITR